MDKILKTELLEQLMWDYNIPPEEIEAVLAGRKLLAGHYSRSLLFRKIIETYPWFTVLQLFTPEEIRVLLTEDIIKKLRVPSLRKKYEFIYRRLQEVIPVAG
jgi:hypothetical protein